MIERYIYAVTKELPKELRDKTAKNLDKIIRDRMNRLPDDLTEDEKIDRVLRALGNPRKLANNYRGKERYLIGPKYFDMYIFVLKVVSLSIFVGLSVAHGFATVFSFGNLYELLGGYLGSLISAVLQGAAWVTGIFALLEYNDISLNNNSKSEVWSPRDLPELPQEKAKISRGESIFSIVFTTILLTLFFISPEIIGIYSFLGESMRFVPLFDLEELFIFRLLMFSVFTIDILIEVVKIIKSRWTKSLALLVTVLNIISSSLLIYILSNSNIWNDEIGTAIEKYLPISFDRLILLAIYGVILVTIVESVSALYKGYKYGEAG